VRNGVRLAEGPTVDRDLVRRTEDEELAKLREGYGDELYGRGRFEEARGVFDQVALADDFVEFLTLPAYELID
jgi:malate synthase